MSKHDLVSKNGEHFSLDLPAPIKRSSIFAFAYAKSGSTLLENIMIELLKYNNFPYISLAQELFKQGVVFGNIDKGIEKILFHDGLAYIGFRTFFTFKPDFDFKQNKRILLVRNPKDMLTSFYFSMAKSHQTPKQAGSAREKLNNLRAIATENDINFFINHVLENRNTFLATYRRYKRLEGPGLKTYRYEDVIFEKRAWIEDICGHFDLNFNDALLDDILKKYDIRPETEDPTKHIRKVTPNNYKEHLNEETIGKIDTVFEDYMQQYFYEKK